MQVDAKADARKGGPAPAPAPAAAAAVPSPSTAATVAAAHALLPLAPRMGSVPATLVTDLGAQVGQAAQPAQCALS